MQSGENKSYFVYHVIFFNIFLVCVCTDFPAAFYVLYTVRQKYFFLFLKKIFLKKSIDHISQNKTQKYISLYIYIIYTHHFLYHPRIYHIKITYIKISYITYIYQSRCNFRSTFFLLIIITIFFSFSTNSIIC